MDLTGKIVKVWITDPTENNGAKTAPAVVVRDWNPTMDVTNENKYINVRVLNDNDKTTWLTSVYPKSDLRPTLSYELYEKASCCSSKKSLCNTTADQAKDNVLDIKFWGDGDVFKLISKASSKTQGWMKSTKAMQVPNGCVVQVTTQQGDHIAEALTFVPGGKVVDTVKDGKIIGRKLM